MAPPRRIDVVLDSVKRLLRIGATANLLNLLQKQHPADLAQIFKSLLDNERQAVFSVLVERNPRLAMETVSEMGPGAGRPAADRPLGRRDRQAPAGDSVGRRGGADRLPAGGAVERGARADAAARVGAGRKPARVRRADRRPHHEPQRLRAQRRPDGRRSRSRRCRARATSRWCSISTSSMRAATWSASPRCAACCSSRRRRRSSAS